MTVGTGGAHCVLAVRVTAADSDEGRTLSLARRLRSELLGLDVDAVEFVGDRPMQGAKSGVGIPTGLQVRVGLTVVIAVVRRIRDWVSRNGCTVEVTLDGDTVKITGATPEQRDRIVEAWLSRHAADAA